MDVIFDIDGTLANAEHRLHFIKDPDKAKDWENFLSDEQVANDTPIPQTWAVLHSLLLMDHRIIFITGRPTSQWKTTCAWLLDHDCPIRGKAARHMTAQGFEFGPLLYMRTIGDRRPSSTVKRQLLQQARIDGFDPKMVFEDRKDDTQMWRSEGLLCCQVADGDY